MNEKLNELLNDLEELKEIDGYTIYQSEANDKDCYTATSCFYEYKELAERYDVNYKKYDMDENYENNEDKSKYEWWDRVSSISYEIKEAIKNQITNGIEEIAKGNEYGFDDMAIDVINNIYDEKYHSDGIDIDEITKEIHYFVGSCEAEELLEATLKECEKRNIRVIE